MARYADGLVLVVRANYTDRKTAQAAVQRLECDGIRVTGVILNRWDPSRSDLYGYPAGRTPGNLVSPFEWIGNRPMTSLVAYDSVPRPSGMLNALVAGYVALLPFQFEVGNGMNFAPADCLMLLVLLLAAGQLKYRKPVWTIWHFGIAATFAAGSLVAALRFGALDRYELLNKDAGLLLPFLSYVAITSAITEWDDLRRILRVFTMSVVLQNIVAVGGFLLSYFFGVANPFARYGGLRLSGMLLDPNAYGGLLVAAYVICEGASLGRAPLFKGPMLWISQADSGAGNSVHLFALRLDGPRSGPRCFSARSRPGWRFGWCWPGWSPHPACFC